MTCAPRVRVALLAAAGRLPSKAEALVENVEWLARTGATAAGAGSRLGLSMEALEKALRRAGRGDLWLTLTGVAR
jgi:hypothetical protein